MHKPLTRRLSFLPLLCGCLATPCVGQTTWTNFENRQGHSLVAEPGGNGLLVFGGATPTGNNLGGTWLQPSGGSGPGPWQLLNPAVSPSPRSGHAMASMTTTDIAIAIAFGGEPINNETWVWNSNSWSQSTAGPQTPSARSGHAMVTFNSVVGEVILLFGGYDNTSRNDTWQFDGTEWDQRFPATSPPARFGHAMTWDEVNQEIVLFGGNGYLADTWAYDDAADTWINRTPASSPPGRLNGTMAHHPVSQRVVLFGGLDASVTPMDDTWTWDGTSWLQATPTNSPPARSKHAMVKDPSSLNVIVVGGAGAGGDVLTGTWEWTGANWVQQAPPPSPRHGAPMAHGQDDGVAEQTVLFGGVDDQGTTVFGDTWHLDGITWSEVTFSPPLPPLPSARSHQGLTFDSGRNRTVMFGGRSGPLSTDPATGDTWEWDGNTWFPLAPAPSPPPTQGAPLTYDAARSNSVMMAGPETWLYQGASSSWSKAAVLTSRWRSATAYDANRNRVVVFGGSDEFGFDNLRSDTWEWDGTSWAAKNPVTVPPVRWSHAMVYDQARQKVVLFGGRDPNNLGYLDDTWEWDGNDWTPRFPANRPSPRRGHAMTYDSGVGRDRVVLFGGAGATGDVSDTWEWDGNNWLLQSPTMVPPARGDSALAFDPTRGRSVLFGGYVGLSRGYLDDTWEWDGSDWVQVTSTGGTPSPRCCHQMAYDTAGRVVLFGGGDECDTSSQTWSWNGTTWTLIPLASSPPKRAFHTLVRDVSPGGLLLFSGRGGPYYVPLSDTWAWNGTGWTERSSGNSPHARFYASAAYDARREEIVLFGGQSAAGASTRYDDTWVWDGTNWSKRAPPVSPSARSSARMVFDERRGCVVLFGGDSSAGPMADTWEWDGAAWTQRVPTNSASPTSDHGMAFDRVRGLTVMLDGNSATWDYGPENAAVIESVPTAASCLSSLGTTPQIDPLPWAGPWLGEPLEIAFTNTPPTIVLMVFGFSAQVPPIPLFALGSPSCTLDVSADVIEVLFPFNNPYISFPMPSSPSVIGENLFAQAAYLPLGMPGVPITTSNSLHMTFGAK